MRRKISKKQQSYTTSRCPNVISGLNFQYSGYKLPYFDAVTISSTSPDTWDDTIADTLRREPDLKVYIVNLLLWGGILLAVGTLVQDLLTAGAGILDDAATLTLAYRMLKVAYFL